MAIDFRCSQCGKLLRTGDETAGRQAQCPACSALTTIPEPSGATPPLTPLGAESSRPPGAEPGAPVDSGPAAAGAGSTPMYQPPGSYTYVISPAQRVYGPATALIVTAILGMLLQVLSIFRSLFLLAIHAAPAVIVLGPNLPVVVIAPGQSLAVGSFGLMVEILILVGAVKMKNLKSYWLAVAAAIIAMVPCISPCCLLGLPFGIWALVVLSDYSVRAAFRS